jgi:SAM-dependent methyltransferase
MTTRAYQGTELALFQQAVNWKNYYATHLRPFIVGDVLEVGAGIGGTTPHVCGGTEHSWTCLEPDPALLAALRQGFPTGEVNGVPLLTKQGTVGDLPDTSRFDTILYVDVLEHIERDADELQAAAAHLVPGGHIVTLSPAHQFLYSEFDQTVGHIRRYTVRQLRALTPPGTRLIRTEYLDSFGTLVSLLNRLVVKQRQPQPAQIAFWDKYLLPISKATDRVMGSMLGRSVIGVWQRA